MPVAAPNKSSTGDDFLAPQSYFRVNEHTFTQSAKEPLLLVSSGHVVPEVASASVARGYDVETEQVSSMGVDSSFPKKVQGLLHKPLRKIQCTSASRRSDDGSRHSASSGGKNSQGTDNLKYSNVGRKGQTHRVPVMPASSMTEGSSGNEGKDPEGSGRRRRRYVRGFSFAAVDRLQFPNRSAAFVIKHNWLDVGHQFDFWFRDRFHMLLSLSFKSLVCVMIFAQFFWASILAVLLAIITRGDVEGCLGGYSSHWINYYFFTVETMFTLGFGDPRYPTCTAADVFTSIAVMLTNVLNGMLVGMVFAKFSSSTGRRWAMGFSPEMCGAIVGSVPPPSSSPSQQGSHQSANVPSPQRFNLSDSFRSKEEDPLRSPSDQALSSSSLNKGGRHRNRLHLPRRGSYQQSAELTKYYQHTYTTTGVKRSSYRSGYDLWQAYSEDAYTRIGKDTSPGNERPVRHAHTAREQVPFECSIATPLKNGLDQLTCIEDFVNPSITYSLSFRMMNLTDSSFFDPKLSIFLLCHDQFDLSITQILRYHTDVPLEFLELPITVTVDSRDIDSPLSRIPLAELVYNGNLYEFVVLLTFVDNQSSRNIELRKSWTLSSINWGQAFKGIVRRSNSSTYEIDVEALDSKTVLNDPLNAAFAPLCQSCKLPANGTQQQVEVVIPVVEY